MAHNNTNITFVTGNLGNDPEMRALPSGTFVTTFSLAVNKSWKDKDGVEHEKTTWFRVSAWNGTGEACNQYLSKGDKVAVTGQVSAQAYLNKEGQPAASLELRADQVEFLVTKGRGEKAETVSEDQIPF